MNDNSTVELFDSKYSFPELTEMSGYFEGRLHRKNPLRIKVGTDSLQNRVYTTSTEEQTLYGQESSTLIATGIGRSLVVGNKGLLRNLQEGTVGGYNGKLIGGGLEGKVYRLEISGSPWALKYYFPVEKKDSGVAIFTPGIDQMRLMQLAQKDNPVEGLRYAVPVIATLDMTLSPFVTGTVSLEDFLVYSFRGMKKDEVMFYNSRFAQIFEEIKNYEMGVKRNNGFMHNYEMAMNFAGQGFGKWLINKLEDNLPFRLMTAISVLEPENNPHNFLIDVDSMYKLFLEFKDNTRIADNIDEFVQKVRQTLIMIELTVGSRSLDEVEHKKRS